MSWFPLVALAVLAGVAFGWRIPAAFAAWFGLTLLVARRPVAHVRTSRAVVEFVVFALLGAVVGALLFDGLGATFGFFAGVTAQLSEVPVIRGRSFRFLRGKRR